MSKKDLAILIVSIVVSVASLALYVGWRTGFFHSFGMKTEYTSFVRADKLKEVQQRKIGVKGKDVIEQEFGAGILRFWPPREVPPDRRVPNEPFVGMFWLRIDLTNRANLSPLYFQLKDLNITNIKPNNQLRYLTGRFYDKAKKEYRSFIDPKEISLENIDGSKAGNGIEMTLDLPKNTQSFDIAFEVEVSYQGKTETIKFQDHFVRSKYLYIPID